MPPPEDLVTKLLRVSHYAMKRCRLFPTQQDPWDIVSHLWLQYHDRPDCHSFTYLRLAAISYLRGIASRRRTRREVPESEASRVQAPARRSPLRLDLSVFNWDRYTKVRRWHIARMVADGLSHSEIGVAFGRRRNSITSTWELMRRQVVKNPSAFLCS